MTELTYDLATRFLSFLRVDVDTEPGDLNLLCIKGMTPGGASGTSLSATDDEPNKYNDTMALISHGELAADGSSAEQLECFVGTVDPGWTFTEDPVDKDGCAHLTFGQHLYKRGLHLGHPALVSANGVNRVWRDKNKNFKPDIGESVFEGYFGVDVHAGGDPDEPINNWSAGCLNIAGGWNGKPYQRFKELVGIHTKSKPVIRVTVWRGQDLVRFANEGATFRPTLILGMKNPWVADLQTLLRKTSPTLTVDGDWRDQTTAAVAAFQAANKLSVDGYVGDNTWRALTG